MAKTTIQGTRDGTAEPIDQQFRLHVVLEVDWTENVGGFFSDMVTERQSEEAVLAEVLNYARDARVDKVTIAGVFGLLEEWGLDPYATITVEVAEVTDA